MLEKKVNISSTKLFRCMCYEEVFQGVLKSFIKEERNKKIRRFNISGGAASGKSVVVANLIVFFLPEVKGSEAMVYVFNTSHKLKIADFIENICYDHGYTTNRRNELDGSLKIMFGNENVIRIDSINTSSIAEIKEKVKVNRSAKTKPVKFIWFEEFTAIMLKLQSFSNYHDIESRILRNAPSDACIFYTYNPPLNKKDIIYEMDKEIECISIKTTIHDLPKRWQDPNTLENALKLKETNPIAYEHTYLGNPVDTEGLAFDMLDEIFTRPRKKEEYISFMVQTDEGTVNATTFGLFGWHVSGELHFIDLWYHSSKMDGRRYSPSEYADKFEDWFESFEIDASITTDGIAFATELIKRGYNKTKSVGSYKDRVLSYQLANKIVTEQRFKIVRADNNMMLYIQMENAEIDFNKDGRAMISKKGESTQDNRIHSHALDLFLYMCLREKKKILRGDKIE